jgi:hypothetical protein
MSAASLKTRIKRLEAELARLRAEAETPRVSIQPPPRQKDDRPIRAGEFLPRGQMVVVNEETRIAYAYPKTKTVPNKVRIHGTTRVEYKEGEAISIRDWWLEDHESDE